MADRKFYAVIEFEDGLQVIPANWLDISVMKAVWPNFTNNKRYDKAVKYMEEPESTWMKHPVLKIYGTYSNYAVARKKLKEAEELSDLNSGTEKEELLKKSRKFRAAKIVDSSTSSNEELSDDSFMSDLPKIPDVSTKAHSSMLIVDSKQETKIAKDAQKNFNSIHSIYAKCTNTEDTATSYNRSIKKAKKDESHQAVDTCNMRKYENILYKIDESTDIE